MSKLLYEDLTFKLIGVAKEVFKELGFGLLESVYEDAIYYEFDLIKIPYKRQVEIDIHYKKVIFEKKFRADLIVDSKILIENKSVKILTKHDEAQLINYLKLTRIKVGLLFNFGSPQFEMLRRIN
jgi:GxxExxY protein